MERRQTFNFGIKINSTQDWNFERRLNVNNTTWITGVGNWQKGIAFIEMEKNKGETVWGILFFLQH